MTSPKIGSPLGTGAMAEVFAYGENALKLYNAGRGRREAFREASVLAALDGTGLPVPAVFEAREYDGRWGLVMSRAEGRSYFEAVQADPKLTPELLTDMTRLQAQIHAQSVRGLTMLKTRLRSAIGRARALGSATQERLREGLSAMPDGDRLCHGDFHPLNIIGEPGNAIIVDWLDASIGEPAADVCRSWLILHSVSPEIADNYLAAYCERTAMSSDEVFAWQPFVAGARLAESSAAGHEDELLEMVKNV